MVEIYPADSKIILTLTPDHPELIHNPRSVKISIFLPILAKFERLIGVVEEKVPQKFEILVIQRRFLVIPDHRIERFSDFGGKVIHISFVGQNFHFPADFGQRKRFLKNSRYW